jgi:asparagine synthase (glutamine-hydrolysing)
MCGIAGWLGMVADGEKHGKRLAHALHHRGPNSQGIRTWRDATLVHTRLSIIDISPTGAQPISNEDGTIWVICNGEIYNHHELRRQLESRGHQFKGHSDTEVIPHLYEEAGLDFVKKLRGMFAFALYDTRSRTMILARDRFGIKPLFYASEKNRLIFASEIKPLLGMPGVNRQPNRQAIYDFSALFYIPAPETFYQGVRSLQPGEMMEARFGADGVTCRTRPYHQWSVSPDFDMTFSQAVQKADELVMAAVRQQMESEVPLGTLLSGGIDSSLVSVAAQAGRRDKLQTFNVSFPQQEYDESWAAMAVARQIGSQHETLEMHANPGTWEHITTLLLSAGQPFADTSLFGVNAVCRLMKKHVTVALSGDGGDEVFGGYNFYQWLSSIARWQSFPAPLRWGIRTALSPMAKVGLVSGRLPQRLEDIENADNTEVIQNLFCWIRNQEHQQLCFDVDVLPVRRLFEPQWSHNFSKKVSRLERLSAHATEINARLLLPNDYLFKVDLASMRESLEVRVPLLDEDLFAFGLTLPHHLKVKGKTCKRVLREVAKRRLPRSVAIKPKRGFGIPMDDWCDHRFKDRLKETLLSSSSGLNEFFRPDVYRPIIEAFCSGGGRPGISREGLYNRAIMLLSVHLAISGA